jgi:hypothetical protein
MFFPEEIWLNIKELLLYRKLEAIKLIRHHTGLPYALSMHNHKGINNNINFLKRDYSWIFTTLHMKQIKEIIRKTEQFYRD